MADIVQSLFGLTPEAYQQQQAAAADRMALEYARLDPLQSARFAIGRGAYQLAGALGGQDPMLQLISNRQAIARETDPTDIKSIEAGILRLRDANDPVGAMQLTQVLQERLKSTAEIGRLEAAAQASRAQAARERVQQTPAEIAKADEVARLTVALQTPGLTDLERMSLEAKLESLRSTKEAKESPQIQLASAIEGAQEAVDMLTMQPQSPERDAALRRATTRLTALQQQLPQKAEQKGPAFGADREAVSAEIYDKPFNELTPTERAVVNKRVEEEQGRRATASAPKIILPGERVGPKDWMQFEKFVGDDPTLKRTNELLAVAPNAIQTISRITTNDVAARALPATLARLVGETGPLSNRDVERYARTGGLDDRLAQAASEFISGRGTNRQKDQAMQFLSAVFRGALLEKKKFYVDQAERLGYEKSPEYTKTIQQIDRELAKFREVRPQQTAAPVAQPTQMPRATTGNPLVDKYLNQ